MCTSFKPLAVGVVCGKTHEIIMLRFHLSTQYFLSSPCPGGPVYYLRNPLTLTLEFESWCSPRSGFFSHTMRKKGEK